MKRTVTTLITLALAIALGSCAGGPTPEPTSEEPATANQTPAAPPAASDIAGTWSGTLDAGNAKLRIVFRVTAQSAGGYTALMDSPDQNARDIPVAAVTVSETVVRLEVAAGVFYEGTLDAGGATMEGHWNQGGAKLPLSLTRGEAAGPRSEAAAGAPDIAGTWSGGLATGTVTLRMVFRLLRDASGAYTALLDSPDEGLKDIPVSAVVVTKESVRLELAAVGAVVDGPIDASATTIDGVWSQSGYRIPLVLKRGEVAAVRRPQNPVEPFPYTSREVTVTNTADGLTLAGTLTLPPGAGPFPAVVLITGSGQQNRDEEILQHKPFLVLADSLTRAGIAVLRYDDRGVGGSTGNAAAATSEDFSRDALAVFRHLAAQPGVDPRRVGLVGHSEGGLIATMLAARVPEVAFIVLLAGPGLPGDEILLLQSAAVMKGAGLADEAVRTDLAFRRRVHDAAKAATDSTRATTEVTSILREWGVPEEQLAATAAQFLSPWMRYFLRHDPRDDLRAVRQPVLALIGGKDVQVPSSANLAAIAAALDQAGNRDYTTLELPGLNHLFQTAGTGMPAEYGAIEETMSPGVLRTVTEWILAR